MTFALVAVIVGGIIAGLLALLWIAAMVITDSAGTPGIFFFLALAFVSLGISRFNAERRATALAGLFPNAYALHVLVLSGQRAALLKYGKDAGTPVRIPWLGGRYTMVATSEWVRLYRGTSSPSFVFEVPAAKVSKVALTSKKAGFGKQSLLQLDLVGTSGTVPVALSAVHFASITPVAIPEEFYDFEVTALNAALHPAAAK